LKIDISPYLSEKLSDFHEILYTAADFELNERHVIKNETVVLDRHWFDRTYFLLSRRSRQRERLSASELSICLSVCLSVCLSICRKKCKQRDFLKNYKCDLSTVDRVMHKRSLCRQAVSVCFLCPSRLCILSKSINISIFIIGYPRRSSFFVPNVMTIFRRGLPNGGFSKKYRWGRQNSRFSTNIWLLDR